MQSIFRLPSMAWCGDPSLEKMRSTPVLEIPMLNKLKRKYSDGPDKPPASVSQLPKKSRPDLEITQQQSRSDAPTSMETSAASPSQPASITPSLQPHANMAIDPTASLEAAPLATSNQKLAQPSAQEDARRMTSLQQVIENEMNMQILFKHNELRLIEQELAKCQIALEQLRRCELRPYPGTDKLSWDVSAGTGPSVTPRAGWSQPSHPAPYGVTDGPYSRHYRRWLLQDSQFDSLSPQMLAQFESANNASGRSTRNSGSTRKFSTKTSNTPGRAVDTMQSIPNYPSAPAKDKSAPLVLKRSTDNQLVKLICNNCNRGNFSSIQGFLNHCRIAHKVDYKSHDLAAIDCGRPLDENEMANLPAETHTTAPKPVVSRASTSTIHTPARRLVHPLNTAVGVASTLSTPISATSPIATPVPSLNSPAHSSLNSQPFKSSSQVPHLSAFFAKHQIGGDLEQAAVRAKQRIELYAEDELLSPQTPEASSPVVPMAGARTVAGVAQPTAAFPNTESARPSSRKGYRQPAVQRPRPSPLAPSDSFAANNDFLQSPGDMTSTASLSPHGVDSNPGLVSDHEDDDHGSASEEEAPHSKMPQPQSIGVNRTCGDHMEIDVTDDEEIGQHGLIIRRNSMLSSEARGLRATGSPSRKAGMGKGGK